MMEVEIEKNKIDLKTIHVYDKSTKREKQNKLYIETIHVYDGGRNREK
jgi:hypothetical protein